MFFHILDKKTYNRVEACGKTNKIKTQMEQETENIEKN